MTRALQALLVLGAIACALDARADTPITGTFELKIGNYKPQVDSEFPAGTDGPYASAFGSKHITLLELEWERQLFQKFGTLGAGASVGYGEVYGHGRFASDSSVSTDNTSLKVYPLKALLTYRLDVAARRFDVPLVPFAKAGLIWQPFKAESASGDSHAGARWGYEGDLGLAFLLDWFDEPLAKDFDIDVGVNHSYFFAERSFSKVDNFGSSTSIRLSDNYWLFGLALEY